MNETDSGSQVSDFGENRQSAIRNPKSQIRMRRVLEPLAMGLMALGAVMMFQPIAQALFSYSFTVILVGTLMFIVVSHLPE